MGGSYRVGERDNVCILYLAGVMKEVARRKATKEVWSDQKPSSVLVAMTLVETKALVGY